MNTSREEITPQTLEKKSEEISVSVYALDFTQSANIEAEKEIAMIGSAKSPETFSFSKIMLKWQNALAVTAILTIAALHFMFQIFFVQSETGKTLVADANPLKIEQIRQQPVEIKSDGFEVKKINEVSAPKNIPQIRQRRSETVPTKPQTKKKDAVETRAERLRRAERILTGI